MKISESFSREYSMRLLRNANLDYYFEKKGSLSILAMAIYALYKLLNFFELLDCCLSILINIFVYLYIITYYENS